MQNRPARSTASLAALIGVALVAACDVPSSPDLIESWTLESWGGQVPPFAWYEAPDPAEPGATCMHVLVSSEIELRTEGNVELIDALTRACGGGEVEPYTETRAGAWIMKGDSLFLAIVTSDPMMPQAPLDGLVDGDRLRFVFQAFTAGGGIDTSTIVFRRAKGS